jgi:lipopolysaccharide biosynthesis protein
MFSNKDISILTEILEEININQNEVWAIYGTGEGAELVYSLLNQTVIVNENTIGCFIDRDEKVYTNQEFQGISVRKLTDICDTINGIIIAAIDNHEIIRKRIQKRLSKEQLESIQIIDIFEEIVLKDRLKYLEYIEKNILKKSEEFIEFDKNKFVRTKNDTKIIAWYLPQFHQIEINNKYHGQGFTEWTNTSRAIPLFTGHYQPHVPYDVGYYDLLNPSTLERQIYLAKHYGVYGFCFYYYWFSGKRLMEKPLELLFEHKELNMPFCINWATENWTTLWDGGNREIIVEQKLEKNDEKRFMESVLPYMKDSRYIKIDGRPILVIYRVNIFEKERIKLLLNNLRRIAIENGFPDLYIMLTNAFDFRDNVAEWGADAVVEFPPHGILGLLELNKNLGYINPYFDGKIFDTQSFIENKKYMVDYGGQTYYRSALTSWDNTARKAMSDANIFCGLNPQTFKSWIKDIVIESKKIHSESEDIIFVNSWNEWAEGSHLEPDMKYGYGYLQALKDALMEEQ